MTQNCAESAEVMTCQQKERNKEVRVRNSNNNNNKSIWQDTDLAFWIGKLMEIKRKKTDDKQPKT